MDYSPPNLIEVVVGLLILVPVLNGLVLGVARLFLGKRIWNYEDYWDDEDDAR